MTKKRVEMTINKTVIEQVLASFEFANLESESARKTIAEAIESALLNSGGLRFDRYWK